MARFSLTQNSNFMCILFLTQTAETTTYLRNKTKSAFVFSQQERSEKLRQHHVEMDSRDSPLLPSLGSGSGGYTSGSEWCRHQRHRGADQHKAGQTTRQENWCERDALFTFGLFPWQEKITCFWTIEAGDKKCLRHPVRLSCSTNFQSEVRIQVRFPNFENKPKIREKLMKCSRINTLSKKSLNVCKEFSTDTTTQTILLLILTGLRLHGVLCQQSGGREQNIPDGCSENFDAFRGIRRQTAQRMYNHMTLLENFSKRPQSSLENLWDASHSAEWFRDKALGSMKRATGVNSLRVRKVQWFWNLGIRKVPNRMCIILTLQYGTFEFGLELRASSTMSVPLYLSLPTFQFVMTNWMLCRQKRQS